MEQVEISTILSTCLISYLKTLTHLQPLNANTVSYVKTALGKNIFGYYLLVPNCYKNDINTQTLNPNSITS